VLPAGVITFPRIYASRDERESESGSDELVVSEEAAEGFPPVPSVEGLEEPHPIRLKLATNRIISANLFIIFLVILLFQHMYSGYIGCNVSVILVNFLFFEYVFLRFA